MPEPVDLRAGLDTIAIPLAEWRAIKDGTGQPSPEVWTVGDRWRLNLTPEAKAQWVLVVVVGRGEVKWWRPTPG